MSSPRLSKGQAILHSRNENPFRYKVKKAGTNGTGDDNAGSASAMTNAATMLKFMLARICEFNWVVCSQIISEFIYVSCDLRSINNTNAL